MEGYLCKDTTEKMDKFFKRAILCEKIYFRLSDALVVVNGSIAKQIEEEYSITENVSTIFNGVNTDKFVNGKSCSEQAEIIKKSMECKYLLLFVGVLNCRKGEFDLIEAMQQIIDLHNNTSLLIIGDGPAKESFVRQIEELNIQNKVKLIANVEQSELKAYYLASDLFVLPSYSEGLPKVLLEAMACGTASVVSDIPAHRSIIRHNENGFLFETGSVDDMSSVIINALGNPDLRMKIALNAKEMVFSQFTWKCVCERLDRIYSDLVNKK